jgi:phage protein D
MLHPSYSVQIGSSSIDPDSSTDLISLRTDTSINGPAGCFEAVLRSGGSASASRGDSVTCSLGYDGDEENVFTGLVDAVDAGMHTVRVFGLNSLSKMMRQRANTFYESQTCGAIVSDMAGTAEVSTGDVDDGLTLPYYTVDSGKTFHEHTIELARRNGFDVFANSDDELCFKGYESSSATTFEYGKDIIQVGRLDGEPLYKAVKVFGESPSSSQGDDAVHWLTKSPVQGDSGSGNELIVQDASLKDTDSVGSAAEAIQGLFARSVVVLLEVVGTATVKLDDTVEVSGMPDSSIDGEYQVARVEHYLSKSRGFTTSFRLLGSSE